MKEMNAQFEKINIIVKYGVIAFFFIFLPFSADAETYDSQSLFSYTGYLTTPSAYITEAQFSLHYSLSLTSSYSASIISSPVLYILLLFVLPDLER